ncbi:hypothetical protein BDZ85DRAFT_278151 [Elsinoe ampelina]|uniref:NmrA-like domain-containing protein n=1 Tax=Elsinoe ampelina TaxID=302913 RepID=A0A6A6GRS5_9PEZI|nr:hypothetical protein BDZ85DRAFT_278151 [Elsinoe ampelina]
MQTIAIAGATGNQGQCLMRIILLPENQSRFKKIIAITRKATDQTAEWEKGGATIATWSDDSDIPGILSDVDVLVNMVGPQGHHLKELLLSAIPSSSIKLYLPSEFGVDHTIHDFSHPEWDYKRDHALGARSTAPNVKTCQVFPGLFLERAIGPWMGFFTDRGEYLAVGSKTTKSSYTSMEDVGRAVVEIALLDARDVPEVVRISGDAKGVGDIAEVMEAAGAGTVKVKEVDFTEFKRKTIEKNGPVNEFIEFVMGSGTLDFSPSGQGNQNELVNPGEKRWKWKTLKDLGEEHGGRPWKEVSW